MIQDESFYEKAKDGTEVEVDLGESVVRVLGTDREWPFEMSDMEKELIEIGGLTSAFRKFGKDLFDVLTMPKGKRVGGKVVRDERSCGGMGDLQW